MGKHSKSYTLEATEKFDELNTHHLGMSYRIGIDRKGKKKGYFVVSNIIRMAFNEIHKSIKDYLKEHPYSRDFTISFVIRNAKEAADDLLKSARSYNDIFEIFNYNCRDLDHHITLHIKYILANCTGVSIISMHNSEFIEIRLANCMFEGIHIHHTDGIIEIATGTEIKHGIQVTHSRMELQILNGSTVNKLDLQYCDELNIFLSEKINNPSISSENSDLYIFGTPCCTVALDKLDLSFSIANIKHVVKANTLRLHKSYIGYFDTLINYGTASRLECDVIDNITNVTNIEGDLIAYKVLLDKPIVSKNDIEGYQGDNRFRIAKVRIPADVPRVIPCDLDPVIRVAKVEVLDMYLVSNDGTIIGSTDEPAYNFMHVGNTIEYRKGNTYEASAFESIPYDAYGPGIYCYTTLEYASKYVKALYEEYNK